MSKRENNILIGEYMGYKKDYYDHGINGKKVIYRNDKIYKGHYKAPHEFYYDTSWNALMEVVDQIEKDEFDVQIIRGDCAIFKKGQDVACAVGSSDKKIDAVYTAVLSLIRGIRDGKIRT